MNQREIKFRVWNTAAKSMYPKEHFALDMDGTELQLMPKCEHYNEPFIRNPTGQESMIYMQFTGLKDKNGKEIFAGDIITLKSYPTERIKVKWDFEKNGWNFANPEMFEVIGDIYENKELNK